MATSRARLEGKRLGLDTVIFVYFLEGHREFGEQAAEIFRLLSAGRAEAVVSMVGIAELLVGRGKIDPNAAEELQHELSRLAHLRVVEVDWPIAVSASAIRAQYRTVGLPDAFHL